MTQDAANQFVQAHNATRDFGQVLPEHARIASVRAGAVKMRMGYAGPKGFGLLHVQEHPTRMKQIEGLGYRTFSEFAFAVCQNYTKILRADDGRLKLVYRKGGYDLHVIVGPDTDEGVYCWSIVTGIVGVARGVVLCEVTQTDESESSPDDA